MNSPTVTSQCFSVNFPRLDTEVEVEASSAGVVIRASRDSFSEERKASFIRELAAEGFIAEGYLWCASDRSHRLRWIVDVATFMPGPAAVARTRRWVLGSLWVATAVWLFLLGGLFLATVR